MISPSSSAVSNMPTKKSSAAISRLLVLTVMFERQKRRTGSPLPGRHWRRAADRAHVADMRVADVACPTGRAPGRRP